MILLLETLLSNYDTMAIFIHLALEVVIHISQWGLFQNKFFFTWQFQPNYNTYPLDKYDDPNE
jgi:hypothetical protein